MPIGKDSITKRVAKVETAPVEVEQPATSKPTTKKTTTKTTTPKKPAAKKPATTVIPNIAPETVKAVVGKKSDNFEKIELGSDLPFYLL